MQEERSYMSLNEKNELEKIEEKIVVKYRKYSKKTERVKKTNQMVIKSDGYSMYVHNKRLFIAWLYNSDFIG